MQQSEHEILHGPRPSPSVTAEDQSGSTLPNALPRPRNLALDLLKCVLALAVVAIHSSPLVLLSPEINSILINGLGRIAVPTFFVINGFYIGQAFSDNASFGSWWRRMAMLYVFWMAVYAPFYLPASDYSGAKLLKTVAFGYLQLWYVAALIVAAPMLYIAHRRISPSTLLRVALVLFGTGVAMQYGFFYSGATEHYTLYRNAVFFGFPFLALGYLLRTGLFDEVPQRTRRLAFGAALAGLAVEIALADSRRRFNTGFDLYASLVLLCPLLFEKARKQMWTIRRGDFGTLSSVIYFAHPLGIQLARWSLHRGVGGAVFLVAILVCLALHYPLTLLSRRCPFIV